MSIHVVCSWRVLLGDITKTALLTKNSRLCLYTGGFREMTKNMWLLWQKIYISCSGEKHDGRLCRRRNENKCEPFCTINQVSLVTHSSAAFYTPTQAHSCKNGLLKDDCSPVSILEFKSTTYHLWLLTRRVKSTELTENPTRHKFLVINEELWLR